MAYNKPPSFDDLAFVVCCAWADGIRRAMTRRADFPGHAPPNYDAFHAFNPHAISAAQGNAAIDQEFVRRTQAAERAKQRDEEHAAQMQQERDNDKLNIPVAALKIILEHDATVARLHTTQVQATARSAHNVPPRTWYFRRNAGVGRRGSNRRAFAPARRVPTFFPRDGTGAATSRSRDVEMRESTPAQAVTSAFTAPAFGIPGPYSFTALSAHGSASTTIEASTPLPPDNGGWENGDEQEDYDMVSDAGAATENGLSEGVAGLGLASTVASNVDVQDIAV